MADLYSRLIRKSGLRIWYAECHYWAEGKRQRAQRSTGIRDDGTIKSERTAGIIAQDIEQSLALGKGRVARPTTLTQAIDALIENHEMGDTSQATINIVIEKGRNLADFFGRKTPLESISDERIREFTKLALAVRAPSTVQRELRTLGQAYDAAKIPRPPMPDLGDTLVTRERWLTRPEQMRLLMAVPPLRKDHVLMYLHTGASKSELYRIERRDCFFDRNEVRIRGTKAKERDRTIPMTPEVRDTLWLRCGHESPARPMFEPWGRGNADRELRRWARAAELGPISFNDLRRTFATVLAAAGVPPLHLMHLMGHSSTKMLEKVYARVKRGNHMHEAVAKLPALRAREQVSQLCAGNGAQSGVGGHSSEGDES
jgi:integrase